MHRKGLGKFLALGVSVLFSAGVALADGESTADVRANHPLGGYVTLWGDPFPALLGANLAYNVYDFLRLHAGVGTDSQDNIHATTFGVGANLFVPGMTLTPVAGLSWSADNVSGASSVDIRGIKHGGQHVYGTLGLDWQTPLGIALGGGYNAQLSDLGGGSGYLMAGFFL